MKKYLLTGALITITATTLYATTASSTVIDAMKAVAHTFTLSTELNAGQTGLTSEPVKGKKTGDILTAGEWNRMLEIVSQGSTGGSSPMGKANLDTGWLNYYPTPDPKFTDSTFGAGSKKLLFSNFTHNLGGNKDNYVVDVQYEQSESNGGTSELAFNNPGTLDAVWNNLTTTSININNMHNPVPGSIKVRIRIWDTSLTPLSAGSTSGFPALYKCTNAQSLDSTNAPCYGASRNGGAGTNQYRVISCTDNDGIRSYTMSSILNFGQLATNKWAVSVNGGTIECDDGTVLVMDTTGNSLSTSGMTSPVVKTKHKPTTSSSLTFDIPAGSRYATARVLGNATGHPAIGNDENHEAMEIFFDFQNGRSSGIHNLVIGVGANWSYGYTWEDHAFGTRVTLKEGDSTLPAGYEIWANGVRPTVNVAGGQLSISGLSNDYISQIWIVTFH